MGLLTFSNKQASNGIKKGFGRLTTSGANSVHFKLIIAKSFVKDPDRLLEHLRLVSHEHRTALIKSLLQAFKERS